MLESANEMMEYDRSNVMFAPDGRLIQVEYARKTVNQGSVTIGMVFKDGVFIVADKRGTNGLLKGAEKIMQIDEHMGAAMSGLISDGRILIESAQLYAQNNRLDYDTPIDVLSMVKYVCRFMQAYTQFGGYRPFGVSLLLAGVDDKPQLYVTEPSGIYFGYKAAAIGEKDDEVREILRKKYKDGLTFFLSAIFSPRFPDLIEFLLLNHCESLIFLCYSHSIHSFYVTSLKNFRHSFPID
jgi:proteasome alpha subunit